MGLLWVLEAGSSVLFLLKAWADTSNVVDLGSRPVLSFVSFRHDQSSIIIRIVILLIIIIMNHNTKEPPKWND